MANIERKVKECSKDNLDTLNLSEKELEILNRKTEIEFGKRIKAICKSLDENDKLKTSLSINDKLYLFCGLIMAGLNTQAYPQLLIDMLYSTSDEKINDGIILLNAIQSFLVSKNCPNETVEKVLNSLEPVFKKKALWQRINKESILNKLFKQVRAEIILYLKLNLHFEFIDEFIEDIESQRYVDFEKYLKEIGVNNVN